MCGWPSTILVKGVATLDYARALLGVTTISANMLLYTEWSSLAYAQTHSFPQHRMYYNHCHVEKRVWYNTLQANFMG